MSRMHSLKAQEGYFALVPQFADSPIGDSGWRNTALLKYLRGPTLLIALRMEVHVGCGASLVQQDRPSN